MELVDTLDLGSSAARCGSSSLPARTEEASTDVEVFFLWRNFSEQDSGETRSLSAEVHVVNGGGSLRACPVLVTGPAQKRLQQTLRSFFYAEI